MHSTLPRWADLALTPCCSVAYAPNARVLVAHLSCKHSGLRGALVRPARGAERPNPVELRAHFFAAFRVFNQLRVGQHGAVC
jgi:hypothetical protein